MSRESLASKTSRSLDVFKILDEKYPNVSTFLNHESTFQLLIAVILSAQCTDERVNLVTPGLFQDYPDAGSLAEAPVEKIRDKIKSINFFNNKSENIKATAEILTSDFDGIVPDTLNELIKLPGVGRKTANVVLGQAFGKPGITVDTHVGRVSRRLGFAVSKDAVKCERELMKVWPDSIWSDFSTILILHGRHTCKSQKPLCDTCCLSSLCKKII